MQTLKCLTSSIALLLIVAVAGCHRKQPLLNETIETVPEPDAIQLAYIRLQPDDPRHVDLEKCFDYEPGIHFYDATESYRILNERGISAEGLASRHDLATFKELADFTAFILAIPKDDGVQLRSFRFFQERVVEGFVPKDGLNCKAIVNWLNLMLVVSYPDNAFIFVDKTYMGRTPRWVAMPRGNHVVRAETMELLIGQEKVTIPGKIQVQLYRK